MLDVCELLLLLLMCLNVTCDLLHCVLVRRAPPHKFAFCGDSENCFLQSGNQNRESLLVVNTAM